LGRASILRRARCRVFPLAADFRRSVFLLLQIYCPERPVFPMMKPLCAIAALTLSFATPLAAQSTSGLTLSSLKTYAYDSVVSWQERDFRPAGLEEVIATEGMVLLDVRAVFDVPWTEDLTRLSISSSDILLVLPDGTEVQSFGSYEYWGMFHTNASSASASRPRDWPDEDQDLYYHSVFLVPVGTTGALLRLPADDGEPGWEGPVEVPAVSAEQDAAMFAEFTVLDVVRTRTLALADGRDSRAFTSPMTAPEGHVFADLDIEVLAFAANEFDGDGRFYWHTYDFRLTGPDGETYPLIGERFIDKLLDSQFNGVAVGDTADRRAIWLVPEGAAQATLMFGTSPVAEVSLDTPLAD